MYSTIKTVRYYKNTLIFVAPITLLQMAPEENFIIDYHPKNPRLIIGSCCSGKFKQQILVYSFKMVYTFICISVFSYGIFL